MGESHLKNSWNSKARSWERIDGAGVFGPDNAFLVHTSCYIAHFHHLRSGSVSPWEACLRILCHSSTLCYPLVMQGAQHISYQISFSASNNLQVNARRLHPEGEGHTCTKPAVS